MAFVSIRTQLILLVEVHRMQSLYDYVKSSHFMCGNVHKRLADWPNVMERYRELRTVMADCTFVGIDDNAISNARQPGYNQNPMLPGMPPLYKRAARRATQG